MVGPSMRPPRSISGSSSAAAAAAVAMAMATVANARFSNAGFSHSTDGAIDLARSSSSPRPVHGSERARLATRMEEYHQLGMFPLLRRSSASARIVDDGSGSSDLPRHRRKLQSYSSSPSSLRNLFIAGGTSLRSPSSTLSTSYRHPDTPPPINKYIPSNVQGGRESQSEAKGAGFLYDLTNTPQPSQGNLPNQFVQPEDPSHYAHTNSDSRRGGSNAPQPPNSDFSKASNGSNEYYNSSSRLFKGLEFDSHTILDQDAPNPFFIDSQQQQQQQQFECTRQNVKEQQSNNGVGWNQVNPVNVHRPLIYTQAQQGPISTQEISKLSCQLIQTVSLSSPDRKPEQQLQQYPQPMKIEPMDDDAFDSSLAMVLDDHLSLMDHLNMIPEVEAYSDNSTLPTIPQFKQENSTISSRFTGTISKSLSSGNVAFGHLAPGDHGSTPISTMLSSLAVSTPSESTTIGSNTTANNPDNNIKHDLKSNNDLMFYFDASEALRPESALSQDAPFTYADHDFLQIKVEPGLAQQQQQLQPQLHQQQQQHSIMSHYTLERQHPFDPSPMLEQQQQPQCDPQSFDHGNSILNADYCYRPLQ
ncbi:hypothetical protein BGX26_003846 [Mortierella sp. AD094]|nr:hypothetical protein BGX26_003846 [Mortierella sp. AD094]